jgi:hypothetical protein
MAEHDLETCPLAPEIQKCDRERGTIMATLVSVNATLTRLEPLIQEHERWIQQSKGAMALIGVLCAVVGGLITTLFSWLTRIK